MPLTLSVFASPKKNNIFVLHVHLVSGSRLSVSALPEEYKYLVSLGLSSRPCFRIQRSAWPIRRGRRLHALLGGRYKFLRQSTVAFGRILGLFPCEGGFGRPCAVQHYFYEQSYGGGYGVWAVDGAFFGVSRRFSHSSAELSAIFRSLRWPTVVRHRGLLHNEPRRQVEMHFSTFFSSCQKQPQQQHNNTRQQPFWLRTQLKLLVSFLVSLCVDWMAASPLSSSSSTDVDMRASSKRGFLDVESDLEWLSTLLDRLNKSPDANLDATLDKKFDGLEGRMDQVLGVHQIRLDKHDAGLASQRQLLEDLKKEIILLRGSSTGAGFSGSDSPSVSHSSLVGGVVGFPV